MLGRLRPPALLGRSMRVVDLLPLLCAAAQLHKPRGRLGREVHERAGAGLVRALFRSRLLADAQLLRWRLWLFDLARTMVSHVAGAEYKSMLLEIYPEIGRGAGIR